MILECKIGRTSNISDLTEPVGRIRAGLHALHSGGIVVVQA